jgi:hypothetical protein
VFHRGTWLESTSQANKLRILLLHTPPRNLDDVLGGALPGRIHFVAGSAGTGKTSAALHFLRSGIERRHRCILVTSDRVGDLLAHADFLGLDLRRWVRARRLTLLRYRPSFASRVSVLAAPHEIVAELCTHAGMSDDANAPVRIVIDSLAPFLTAGHPSPAPLTALADWLDECGATSVVTWRGDIADCDRRLDGLVERAAVILRVRPQGATPGRFRADIVRARHAIAATRFVTFDVVGASGASGASALPSLALDPIDTMLGAMDGDRPPA